MGYYINVFKKWLSIFHFVQKIPFRHISTDIETNEQECDQPGYQNHQNGFERENEFSFNPEIRAYLLMQEYFHRRYEQGRAHYARQSQQNIYGI